MTIRENNAGGDSSPCGGATQDCTASSYYYREQLDLPVGWPTLGDAAFQGPAGELVRAIVPYTEADPAGVLIQLLVMAGVLVGRKPYLGLSGEQHRANLMCVLLGATGSGRKGTSGAAARRLLCDKGTIMEINGLASGEALVDALSGHPDAKGLIIEEEYARWLKAAGRTASTLSETSRVLYDGKPLTRRTTEHGEQRVEDYHVSMIGHCTPTEFVACLSDLDQSNGAANRLLIIPVASRQLIFFNDDGDEGAATVPSPVLSGQRTLAQIATKASQRERVKWSDSAFQRAREFYFSRIMFHPSPLLARQWTNFCRLTLIYALLDETDRIEVEHVEAAASIIRYSRIGVEQIFEHAPRPRLVEDILRHVRSRGNRGITLTDLTREFSNHLEIGKRNEILTKLLGDGLIVRTTMPTMGRPAEWLVATEFSTPSSAAEKAK